MKQTDYKALKKIVTSHVPDTHEITVLGEIAGEEVILISPKEMEKKKNVLVVAGFHGEEVAGPWGIAKFMKSGDMTKHDLNISVIPVINPDGFVHGRRYNRWHETSNGGFLDGKPSHEGALLLKDLPHILELAKDGFITLHENSEYSDYYFYMLAKNFDAALAKKFVQIASKRFDIKPDGEAETKFEGKFDVKDGCVFDHPDDSFEYFLFKNGVPICITNETPMLKTNLADRIDTTHEVLNAFLSHVEGSKKDSNDWVGNFLSTAKAEKVYKFDRKDAWGYCCAMDLVDCDPKHIRDKALIERFIKTLCSTIKANPYGAPTIARIGEGKRLFGWSFTQLVTTSSITGHFVESNNSCYIDVFFCNWFDPDVAVKFTQNYFEAKKIRVKLFTRSEPDES